jgi:hypothetical protein
MGRVPEELAGCGSASFETAFGLLRMTNGSGLH